MYLPNFFSYSLHDDTTLPFCFGSGIFIICCTVQYSTPKKVFVEMVHNCKRYSPLSINVFTSKLFFSFGYWNFAYINKDMITCFLCNGSPSYVLYCTQFFKNISPKTLYFYRVICLPKDNCMSFCLLNIFGNLVTLMGLSHEMEGIFCYTYLESSWKMQKRQMKKNVIFKGQLTMSI